MTMHIVGPYLSTTNTKKRQQKITKSQQEEIERGWRERNARLREMGLPKETLEQYTDWLYGRGKKEKKKTVSAPVTKTPSARPNPSLGPAKTENGNSLQNNDSGQEHQVAKSLSLWITGPVSSKPSPTYTGSKIKGIGTMHKSNAVPIFTDEEAKDISKMRR